MENSEIYLNFGRGFHSNDARSTVIGAFTGAGPSGSGVVAAAQPTPLVKALGYELGARTHLFDRLDLAAALWNLNLGSELVFSGDAGTDEASSLPSRRYGVDFEARWQINEWLSADYDLSWSHARFSDGGFVPLAVPIFMNGGLTADFHNGLTVALRGRYVSDRAGNEDDTVTARGLLPARPLRALSLAQSGVLAPAPESDRHRLARGAVLRQFVRAQRDADPEPRRALLLQAREGRGRAARRHVGEDGAAGRQHPLHARKPDRRRRWIDLVLLTIRMDCPPSGLHPRGHGPYDWEPSMSDSQQRLRLTAALAASAAVHAAVLLLLVRSVPLVDLLAGGLETTKAKLIRVSLVSRPGGGGGGPLPGTPSAALGRSDSPPAPSQPLVAPAPSPPPPPLPTTQAKPAAVATPSPTAFASLRALAAPAPSRPQPAAPPMPAAPAANGPAAAPSSGGTGDRVGSLGGPGGGRGGAGTGDGSGGDGSDGSARPAYGSNPKPPYPLAARRLGVEGVVTLEVLVRPDGSPAEVRVQSSSGSPLLDESALDTVRTRWRFLPARRGNVPVESRVTFPVRFRLSEG